MDKKLPLIVAVTGASGTAYAVRFCRALTELAIPFQLILSDAAREVWRFEMGRPLGRTPYEVRQTLAETFGGDDFTLFDVHSLTAPPASGSVKSAGMVVIPCSMGTLAHIAGGLADNLIHRAADVVLKEHRPLVIVPREAPLSAIHLENMLKLARLGAHVIPASPGFYHHPRSIDDLVDFVVARVLDALGIDHSISRRWDESKVVSELFTEGTEI